MLNSNRLGQSTNKLNESDLPTAVKTNYQDQSPYRRDVGTPSLRSPSRYSNRLQDAKNSISSIINEMANKKDQNIQAIGYVRGVNADAAGHLREQQEYVTFTPSRSQKDFSPIQARNYGTFPENYQPSAYNDRRIIPSGQFNMNEEQTNYGNFDSERLVPGGLSLQQENLELRRALNNQIRENSELMRRIRFLEEENSDLRGQLGMGLVQSKNLRSTNYNSYTNGDAGYDYGSRAAESAKFGNVYHPFDNQFVKSVCYQAPHSNRREYQQGAQEGTRDLFLQMQQLKDENERLRQEAIGLLKQQY